MIRLLAIALCVVTLLASMRADADMLLLNAGSAGGFVLSSNLLTNDAGTNVMTDDAGTNTLVAQ